VSKTSRSNVPNRDASVFSEARTSKAMQSTSSKTEMRPAKPDR